jgi:signal transduction histidine kinase
MTGRLRALRGNHRNREPGVVPESVLRDMSRRLRGLLSSEDVARAAADACATTIGFSSFSFWLGTGAEMPKLAYAVPAVAAGRPPEEVVGAVRRRKTIPRPGNGLLSAIAVPLVAPRAGTLGALFVERLSVGAADVSFIEFLAQETALALETANFYEEAIAARDRSEALLARVADAIVVTDPRGRVLHRNEAARWVLDDPPSRNGHSGCAEAMGLHDGERALDCSKGCALLGLLPDGDPNGHEVWRKRPDGRRQPLLANVSAVNDAEGRVTEVVHSLRDITRLKQADEAKTLFLATASHELKTPLTVIQGYSELLANARLAKNEDREQAALAIQRRAVQLNSIVDRLLLSSRIETGRVEIQLEEVALVPIITERVQALHATSGRVFATAIAEAPAVSGNAAGIMTVIDHLLDNAVKYSPSGGDIDVAIVLSGDDVVLSITDHGIGMDPDQAAHCFDKFWQAESTDGRRFSGTGIGLYIVRSLVEAMGGQIGLHTEPGRGSTFSVTLRRWGATAAADARTAERERPITPEPSVIREFMRQIGIPSERRKR